MIDRETIERIKDVARIEEVVGEFVSLRKHGANYIACCPFHQEKTPSFHVNPARGIFKCFGCGEGGDSVSFLMKHERYTYPEALRYLAGKYHIDIVEEEQTEEERRQESERDALFHVTEFAQKYFADLLFNDEMGTAVGLSYFHERGMTDEIVKKFGLGYCKDVWDDFTKAARRGGYDDKVLEHSGLTIFKEGGGSYDRFRGRVMFPIYSISGRVLGFSGRVLSSEKQHAKYVNSPESEIYVKGSCLYGLYQARQAVSREDKCYLVEGNVDVVSMHQSGVENTVASCGTALTRQQIGLIRRYTKNVTVLYDGDGAGIKATLKAVDLLFGEGMHVRTVLFPDGEDPDSYARKYGSTQLKEYLATHEENFLLYKMRVAGEEMRRDPIRRSELQRDIIQTIALVPDVLERGEYVKECASMFGVPESTFAALLAKALRSKQENAAPKNEPQAESSHPAEGGVETQPLPTGDERPIAPPSPIAMDKGLELAERKIVSILVVYGNRAMGEGRVVDFIVNDLEGDELSFDHPVCRKIYELYRTHVAEGRPLPDANFFAMSGDVAMRQMALEMMIAGYEISPLWRQKNEIYTPTPEERLEEDVVESLLSYKLKKVEQRMESVDLRLRQTRDESEMLQLLAEKKQLVEMHVKIGNGALRRVIS